MSAVRPMMSERSDNAESRPTTGNGNPESRLAVSRREWMRSVGRAVATAALAAVAVLLGRRRAPAADQQCTGGGVCRTCGSLDRCGLPQGLSLKAAIGSRP